MNKPIEQIKEILKTTRLKDWQNRTGYKSTGAAKEPDWQEALDQQQAEAIYKVLKK